VEHRGLFQKAHTFRETQTLDSDGVEIRPLLFLNQMLLKRRLPNRTIQNRFQNNHDGLMEPAQALERFPRASYLYCVTEKPDHTVWAGIGGTASAPPARNAPEALAANELSVDEEEAERA
jgi:hypothetical protein